MLAPMDDPAELQVTLRREQIRLLACNVPALAVGTMALGVGTAVLLWSNGQPVAPIGGWLAALSLLSLWRWWMAQRFGRRTADGEAPERWSLHFVAVSALAGLCWGSLAWLFFTPDNPLNLAVVAIVQMAILTSATQSLGPYFPAHLAFAIPCTLPFAIRCLSADDPSLHTLGWLTLVFLVMAELFSRRIAQAIEEALRLRFENESLVAQLTVEKERAETANRTKSRFLATASHDLRQPIHALSLFVPALQTLARRPEVNPATVGGIADRMQGAIDTMAQLLNRLLDISRLDAGATPAHLQPVPLQPLLRRVCDEIAQQARAKGLTVRVHDRGRSVLADPGVLHTILSNLAANAVRYTERGGVLLAARARGNRVSIEVWDSGVGIDAADLPHVTEEFYQADNVRRDTSPLRGFGLGLAIVKRSADLLGSQLRCRSHPGRGSVFAIDLPGAEPAPAAGPEDGADRQPQPARLVLVVDDDEQILSAMSFLLRGWGHEMVLARSLDQALKQLEASPRKPDVALIDMHLAAGHSGLEVVAALRDRLDSALPMAIITGDTGAEVMASMRAARVTGLHKPVDPAVLRRFLDALPPPTPMAPPNHVA